jgi:4-amino-4-deoxy-L-arabinose transferase-like glycosyltransferase
VSLSRTSPGGRVADPSRRPRDGADGSVRRARTIVLAIGVAALAAKITMALTTYGTIDIRHWQDFVDAVAAHGPVGIYGVRFAHSFYNHPPLMGYLLLVIGWAARHGVSVGVTLRSAASLADLGSALLVLELARARRRIRDATAAAVLVAASPVLVVISGFHGNSDPIFVFLVLLAAWLLTVRDRPGWAGIACAAAIGVKIVPLLVVPALLAYAWRAGRRRLCWFATGVAGVSALIWAPAVLSHYAAVRADVLGYTGSGPSQWGLVQFGRWVAEPGAVGWLGGPGRFLVVGACALAPALLVWRRPAEVAPAVGLALAGFLLLTPAFGTQYLVWGVAALYLLDTVLATAFNLLAGALLLVVYTRWNRGLPWDFAGQWGLRPVEVGWAFVVWLVLAVAVLRAAIRATDTYRHSQ